MRLKSADLFESLIHSRIWCGRFRMSYCRGTTQPAQPIVMLLEQSEQGCSQFQPAFFQVSESTTCKRACLSRGCITVTFAVLLSQTAHANIPHAANGCCERLSRLD